MPFNTFEIQQQITGLKLSYPDLFEDEDNWLLAIESETDLDQMLTSIVRQIDDAKAMESGTKERLDELKARKDRFARRQEALRNLAFKIMDHANVRKMELPLATLSIRNGQPQLVGDAPAGHLPDDLCKISREVDRTKIKDALKAGLTVPGFEISNGQPSLSIRIK